MKIRPYLIAGRDIILGGTRKLRDQDNPITI